jgi:hypothetical protein
MLLVLRISDKGHSLVFKKHSICTENVQIFFFLRIVETGSLYVVQGGLELAILLPQPPECWDYRCARSHLAILFFCPDSLGNTV